MLHNYNNINFFFTLILHTFQRNLKRHAFFDYNDANFNAHKTRFPWKTSFMAEKKVL